SPRSQSYDRGSPAGVPLANRSSGSGSSGIGMLLVGLLGAIPAGIGSIFGVRRWRRHRSRRCPECGTRMERLDESADDALLQEGQQAEERIGSVDYDVWKC